MYKLGWFWVIRVTEGHSSNATYGILIKHLAIGLRSSYSFCGLWSKKNKWCSVDVSACLNINF